MNFEDQDNFFSITRKFEKFDLIATFALIVVFPILAISAFILLLEIPIVGLPLAIILLIWWEVKGPKSK